MPGVLAETCATGLQSPPPRRGRHRLPPMRRRPSLTPFTPAAMKLHAGSTSGHLTRKDWVQVLVLSGIGTVLDW